MRDYLKQLKKVKLDPGIILFDLFKTILIYLVATSFALCLVELNVISDNIFGIYMLAVAITSIFTSGYAWGIFSSIGGVVAVNYFFTFPYFTLNFSITGYPITFTILLFMSILTSALTGKVKKAAVLSAIREKRAENLTQMSNAFLSANDLDTILKLTAEYFYSMNHCSVIVYLGSPLMPEKRIIKTYNNQDELIFESPLEIQVAQESFISRGPTGINQQLCAQNCKGTYLPIATTDRIYGVLGLIFENPNYVLDDTFKFAQIMITQTILALDRQALEEKTQEILLEKGKEKMRSNLLRAVSHDLRTPLTCILGASAALQENKGNLEDAVSDQLLEDIHHDAEWLIHMVENLLSITKISGDGAKVKKQDEIVEEIVAESVMRIHKRFPEACVNVSVPDELLIVPMDATLIEQVLINLMENAIRHSGSDLPIGLRVYKRVSGAVFTVSDSGKGIDPDRIPNIFDGKSTDGSSDSTRGIGIGLSICKTIILAHEGKIFAKNYPTGGASFTFVLPLKGETSYVDENEDLGY